MKISIHTDSFENLILYSPMYLFDKKLKKLNKISDKGDIEEIYKLLNDNELKSLKDGWTVKVEIPEEYGVILFE